MQQQHMMRDRQQSDLFIITLVIFGYNYMISLLINRSGSSLLFQFQNLLTALSMVINNLFTITKLCFVFIGVISGNINY